MSPTVPALPVLAGFGIASMTATIPLARWNEMGSFADTVSASALLYWAMRNRHG